MMDDQGRRMAQLVEDLLSLSRIELKEHAQPKGSVQLDRAFPLPTSKRSLEVL